MTTLSLRKLLSLLERLPDLQDKNWERNQSGIDRGIEAILIQRSPRELATYALARLRFEAMPELLEIVRSNSYHQAGLDSLIRWARTQGPGGSTLANLIENTPHKNSLPTPRLAAISSLKYYHQREDDNPAVKNTWTQEGLARVDSLDLNLFLTSPTRGNVWKKKFDTVQRLVVHVRHLGFHDLTDDAMVQSLKSIDGIGNQTASMIALFWFGRPVPILDGYLERLLTTHGLIQDPFPKKRKERDTFAQHLVDGARQIEAHQPEWPATRVLSCLYLWACEIGRLHCDCGTKAGVSCPIARALAANA